MRLFTLSAAAALMLSAALAAAPAAAQTASEVAAAKADIWAKEQAVYSGRASGDMTAYKQATHPAYMAWPPFSPKPYGVTGLKETGARVAGGKEKLDLQFVDFTMSGDTGIIYYQTHRTALGDGTPVDQIWETIHVWKKDAGEWKVMGGMSREAVKR